MESLICALHLHKLNKLNKPSPVQACSAWQGTSRAELRLGLGPSLRISARLGSYQAEQAEPSWLGSLCQACFKWYRLCRSMRLWNIFHILSMTSIQSMTCASIPTLRAIIVSNWWHEMNWWLKDTYFSIIMISIPRFTLNINRFLYRLDLITTEI